MRRDFFAEQMKRLADGFGASISSERMGALWTKFRHFTEPHIRAAVDELLTGARYPGRMELEKAAFEARERDLSEQRQRMHASDRSPWRPDLDSGPCPPSRARFFTGVMRWFAKHRTWPEWDQIEQWCAARPFADPPSDWREILARVWAQNPPGTPGGDVVRALAGKP